MRRLAGLSLEALALEVGVAFQQLQKYENGANRISASKLHSLAVALGCGVADFFDGLPGLKGGNVGWERVRTDIDRLVAAPGGIALLQALATVPEEALPLVTDLAEALAERRTGRGIRSAA